MNIPLKNLRISHNETQNDVANFLGVSRTTYLKYENGLHEPSFDTLKKLADHYDVSIDYLLGKEEKPAANDELSEKNVKFIGRDGTVKYKKLSPEMISMLEQLPDSDENL